MATSSNGFANLSYPTAEAVSVGVIQLPLGSGEDGKIMHALTFKEEKLREFMGVVVKMDLANLVPRFKALLPGMAEREARLRVVEDELSKTRELLLQENRLRRSYARETKILIEQMRSNITQLEEMKKTLKWQGETLIEYHLEICCLKQALAKANSHCVNKDGG